MKKKLETVHNCSLLLGSVYTCLSYFPDVVFYLFLVLGIDTLPFENGQTYCVDSSVFGSTGLKGYKDFVTF